MKLIFESRSVYGKVLFYPTSPEAQAIVAVTGRKCLRSSEIERLRYGGFVVEVTERSES